MSNEPKFHGSLATDLLFTTLLGIYAAANKDLAAGKVKDAGIFSISPAGPKCIEFYFFDADSEGLRAKFRVRDYIDGEVAPNEPKLWEDIVRERYPVETKGLECLLIETDLKEGDVNWSPDRNEFFDYVHVNGTNKLDPCCPDLGGYLQSLADSTKIQNIAGKANGSCGEEEAVHRVLLHELDTNSGELTVTETFFYEREDASRFAQSFARTFREQKAQDIALGKVRSVTSYERRARKSPMAEVDALLAMLGLK